jgi:hypothetical protein
VQEEDNGKSVEIKGRRRTEEIILGNEGYKIEERGKNGSICTSGACRP